MRQQAREVVLLIARLVVGGTFIAHGLQKLTSGMSGVAESFAELGIPLPTLAAWFTALVETFGGLALVVGLVLEIAGTLLAAVMIGAMVTAHLSAGFFAQNGGFEYVLVLSGVSLALGWSQSRLTVAALFGRDSMGRVPVNA